LRNLQSWAVIRDRNRPPAGSFMKTAGSFEVCEIAGTGSSLILQSLENQKWKFSKNEIFAQY
jgi:hypothetical protein